ESLHLFSPDIGDGAAHFSMRGLLPKLLASKLQPDVQGFQRWKARQGLPQPMASVLDVFLDLSLLPASRRIAELRFVEIVTGHGHETDIDVPLLAASNLVDGRAHVVVDAAPGNATEDMESMVVGVEQHLMCL